MKVLFYGIENSLGREVFRLLRKEGLAVVGGTWSPEVASIYLDIENYLPSRVVVVAGEDGDGLGSDLLTYVVTPSTIASCCGKYGIHCTYLAGGLPWPPGEVTTRTLPAKASCGVAVMKGMMDRIVKNCYGGTVLNLRLGRVMTSTSSLSRVGTGTTPGSWSVLETVVPVVGRLVEAGEIGTRNLVNPGLLSETEVATRLGKTPEGPPGKMAVLRPSEVGLEEVTSALHRLMSK